MNSSSESDNISAIKQVVSFANCVIFKMQPSILIPFIF